MTEGARPSMYEKVRDLEEQNNNQDKKIDNHEERIIALEKVDEKHEERLKNLEEQSIKLENTILKTSTETREVMREQTETQTKELYSLLKTAMGIQSTRTTQNHEFKMLKWNTISTIGMKVSGALLGLLSSGGLVYYYVTQILFK
ncbi:hypothetical protein MKX53_17360 [Psychrobacillus sp. FSL K6-4615]|uniref:hypothetical protein n=1 Tax=Psychrobacillus sp. FSL K6-4615 TaxID=2921551 RepID=UPI0030F7B32D